MFELEIGRLMGAHNQVCVFGQMLAQFQGLPGRQPQLSQRDADELKDDVRAIIDIATTLEMAVTALFARTLLDEIERVKPDAQGLFVLQRPGPFDRISNATFALQNGMKAEATTKWLIGLGARGHSFWAPLTPPFGSEVESAFPTSAYDIEEAGKCLAVGRSTAAVFHLMRAMEAAVRVLGVKLNATVVDANGDGLPWGVIVANIKPKIDALPKGADQDEWYKIHALLHSVNRAFRTKTAHPIDKYTEEEAENAFNATKAFLQEMVERCA